MVIHSGFELFEWLCEELAEVGRGEDTGIESAFAQDTEVLHVGLKAYIGHRTRVLEFAKNSIVEAVEVAVGDDLFDGFLAGVCDTMFGSG